MHNEVGTCTEILPNFAVLRKCQGKMDCLVYEMLLIKGTDQVFTSNQTQYVLKYSLDFVFLCGFTGLEQ